MEQTLLEGLGKIGFFNRKNTKLITGLVKATDGNTLDFLEIASHPKTPVHVLNALLATENDSVVKALTRNPRLPISLIKKIISKERFIKYVMDNCKITVEIFEIILRRLQKAFNHGPDVLFNLSDLASNSKTPAPIIKACYQLARNKSNSHGKEALLFAILQNQRTPTKLIRPAYALYIINLREIYPGELSNGYHIMEKVHEVNEVLVENPHCPPTLYHMLMRTGNAATKLAGAENPLLFSPSRNNTLLQEKLWHDKSVSSMTSDKIWQRMLKNPLCSEHYFIEFAKTEADHEMLGYQRRILLDGANEGFGKSIDTAAAIRILETFQKYTNSQRIKEKTDEHLKVLRTKLKRPTSKTKKK